MLKLILRELKLGRGNPEVNKTPIESLLNKLHWAFGASHPHIVNFTFEGAWVSFITPKGDVMLHVLRPLLVFMVRAAFTQQQ